jgi:hypothetical protein
MMPEYWVAYCDSKGRRHGEILEAATAAEAKKAMRKKSVTVEGLGGKYRTVARVLKAERVST